MSVPAVSVVMPVYNMRRYVGRAVASILGQTHADFEFIILDDGSDDGTFQLVQAAAERDSRVQVVRQDHAGVSQARIAGARLAQGEFLAVMDADDIAVADRLEKQVAYLNDHPDCVAVGGQRTIISPHGVAMGESQFELDHDGIDSLLLLGRTGIAHPTAMIRTAGFREVGGYRRDLTYAEDLDLFLRLAETGRLANLPDIVLRYRRHIDSISHAADRDPQVVIDVVHAACRRRGIALPQEVPGAQFKQRSPVQWHYRFARLAIQQRHFGAAWSHVFSGLRLAPARPHSWRLALSALFRREI